MTRLVGLCIAMLFAIGAGDLLLAAENLVLATGNPAGNYYPFGKAMSKIWNSRIEGLNVTAQTSGGSAENVRLINRKDAELALAQSDTLDFAFYAKETYKEPLKGMSAVAVLYPEVIQVVVAAESPVKSFTDLKGRKVGVGPPASGTENNFRQLLDAHGMKKEDVEAQYLSFSESVEAFKAKRIDAFTVTGAVPISAIKDVADQNTIRILPLAENVLVKLSQKYPFLTAVRIQANTYRGQAADVPSAAVNAVLIAGSQVKAEIVYSLTKALFENLPELAATHTKGKDLNLQHAVQGVSIPFHPGALKYYSEKGVIK